MKFLLSFLISLVAAPKWVFSEIQLTSSGPETVRPGENLNLVCKVTGFSINTYNYAWDWIRQPPGKGLEWVAEIYPYVGRTYYPTSLRSRTTVSADTSKNEFSLRLISLTAADSALYFCARRDNWGAFDYWGQGTMVTVTSENPTAPSVFPLSPCCEDLSTASEVTMGCLISGYFPQPVTVQWNGGNISSGIQKFSADVGTINNSTSSSFLTIPVANWKSETFQCNVAHEPTNTSVSTQVSIKSCKTENEPVAPTVRLLHSPCKPRSSGATVELMCIISGFYPADVEVNWLENNEPKSLSPHTDRPWKDTDGYTFSTISTINVTQSSWLEGASYACQVTHTAASTPMKSQASICTDCEVCEAKVQVETIPPSFADMYQSKSAKLTCRVSNIPSGTDLKPLNISWTQGSDRKPLETTMDQPKEQENDMLYVDATTTVCMEDWYNSQNTFNCKAAFSGLLPQPEEKTLKRPNGGTRYHPLVYVLPPPTEELALREKATLTCLVKGFYPNDFFVKWLRNDEPVNEADYFTSKATMESKSPEKYFAYSMLQINEQDWSAGDTFACVVGHEALPLNLTQKTVDKNTGKPTNVNVSLVLSDTNTCY